MRMPTEFILLSIRIRPQPADRRETELGKLFCGIVIVRKSLVISDVVGPEGKVRPNEKGATHSFSKPRKKRRRRLAELPALGQH